MKKVFSYLIVLAICLFTFTNVIEAKAKASTPSIEKIGDVSLEGKKLIYIGRDGCSYCKAFVPGLKYLSEKYEFTYEYVNTDTITEDVFYKWLSKIKIDEKDFGTPTIAIFENSNLKDVHQGFMDEESLFTYLKEYGIIGKDKEYETRYKTIKFINNNDYLDIVKSNKKSLIVLTQKTNYLGIESKPYLEELSKELNIDIYYYDLSFESQEEFDSFVNSNKYITKGVNEETLKLPTFMIIKGDKTRAVISEYSGKNDLEDFIKTYLVGNKIQDEFKIPVDYNKITIIVLSILLLGSIVLNVYKFIEINKFKNTKSKSNLEEKKEETKKEVKNRTTKTVAKKPATKKATTKSTKKK